MTLSAAVTRLRKDGYKRVPNSSVWKKVRQNKVYTVSVVLCNPSTQKVRLFTYIS